MELLSVWEANENRLGYLLVKMLAISAKEKSEPEPDFITEKRISGFWKMIIYLKQACIL